jgi:outer membrane protein assembly factor BamB
MEAMKNIVLLLGCALMLGFGTTGPATGGMEADRAQWGQRWSRNMASDEAGLPDSFDPSTGGNIKWAARLGSETHGTPVIAGGRVFIGTNNGAPRDPQQPGDRGVLMCFDEKDGHFLWQLTAAKLTTSIYWDWPHAGICSPATVEAGRLYITTNRGEVVCLDAAGKSGPGTTADRPLTSNTLWSFDILKECGVRQHDSAHASILAYGPFLYLNTSNGVDDSHRKIDAPDAPSLIVLDKASGRLVAADGEHIGPRIFHSTWSSPALGEVQGKPRIFFAGGDGVVYAFEPVARAAGSAGAAPRPAVLQKIWQFDCDPAAPKEAVHRFNGNRRESPSNIKSMPVFYRGRVYVTVGGDLWWGKHQAWLKCIDAGGRGDVTKTAELWSYPLERHSMCTPAIGDGLVFVGDSGRKVHCIDAETGLQYWTHAVEGEVWASPLLADGKVYFATRQGEVLVFAASKEKKLLAQMEMDTPISGSPVAANGVLYITTMTRLYAIRK